jgi:hypothetical protein
MKLCGQPGYREGVHHCRCARTKDHNGVHLCECGRRAFAPNGTSGRVPVPRLMPVLAAGSVQTEQH